MELTGSDKPANESYARSLDRNTGTESKLDNGGQEHDCMAAVEKLKTEISG